MSRKILIHSLIFSPDGVSTAYLYNDITLEFQRQGYDVVVLTTTPHYNVLKEKIEKQPLRWKLWGICKESKFHGITVYHIPQKKFKSTFLRLLGFTYWHVMAFLLGVFIKHVDIILSPSPPLTIGIINLWLAFFKGCKVVYNVQEIYPDILGRKEGIIVSVLRKMERYVYNASHAVTTIDQVFYNTLVPRFKDSTKLHVIPNFVDTELYNSNVGRQINLDEKLFPKIEGLKLLYAGNIGFAQDWVPLISLAEQTKGMAIEYFIIGEGVMKEYIQEQIKEKELVNVHLLPYQARELMPSILAYSDIQFVFMNPTMEMQGFPSKVYTIMACAKPLLVCSGENTPIINFLKPYQCAKLVTEEDERMKVAEMCMWLRTISKERLSQMGKNGKVVIEECYAKDIVTKQYVKLADFLLDNNF